MAGVASTSSARHNPFPALTWLPEDVRLVAEPAKVRMPENENQPIALWDANTSSSDIQLRLLDWLAHNSSAASAARYDASDKHMVFTLNGQGCIRLVPGHGIICRLPAVKGQAYTSLVLGHTARQGRRKGKRVTMDAHRMVCWLTHGEQPTGAVALHTCHDKTCVNSEHLRWDSQSTNIREARNHRRAVKVGNRGAWALELLVGSWEAGGGSFSGPCMVFDRPKRTRGSQAPEFVRGRTVRTSRQGAGRRWIGAVWDSLHLRHCPLGVVR